MSPRNIETTIQISSRNLQKLKQNFGTHIPEGQECLPGIQMQEGDIPPFTSSMETELFPTKDLLFSQDPRDGLTIY